VSPAWSFVAVEVAFHVSTYGPGRRISALRTFGEMRRSVSDGC
jgi:hypothetical protein